MFGGTRCLLLFVCLGLFSTEALAKKTDKNVSTSFSQVMSKGKKEFSAKRWKKALSIFQKALKLQRGKPLYRKTPTYMYIGMSLYKLGHKGLAWKAFEQALFKNSSLKLIGSPNAALKSFYAQVKERIRRRGGRTLALSAASSSSSSSSSSGGGLTSPWPWALLTVSVGLVSGGLLLVIDASGNQAELSQWVKEAAAGGIAPNVIEEVKRPMSDSVFGQNALGGSMLVLGGLGLAGAILLFVLPKSPKKVASNPHFRQYQLALEPIQKQLPSQDKTFAFSSQ